MNDSHLPKLDSIDELARFWDSHDLTNFEHELEEVPKVFARAQSITVQLDSNEAKAVHDLAQAKGIPDTDLIRNWILERIQSS